MAAQPPSQSFLSEAVLAEPSAAAFVCALHCQLRASYFPLGGLFPRPEPDLFPVVDGPFVGRGFAISLSFSLIHFFALQLNVAWHEEEIIEAAPIREEIGNTVAKLIMWETIGLKITSQPIYTSAQISSHGVSLVSGLHPQRRVPELDSGFGPLSHIPTN
ncbi:hypothetical protein [Ruegeria atlantica]|uniref:hypothetical protein n=1 Tax=Ruegeria atlantica TaxID=81569 RepID=UPI0024945854|nr:hypothetical protein [Ruegeria atlantica]